MSNDFAHTALQGASYIHILRPDETPKYLGRRVCFAPGKKTDKEIKNRMASAWAQYQKHRATLTNKSVSVRLGLRLFVSTVTPRALYGLGAATLTRAHLEKLDKTQRKMLRNIVGWVRWPDESWRDTMVRMKARVEKALELYPVQTWSSEALNRK